MQEIGVGQDFPYVYWCVNPALSAGLASNTAVCIKFTHPRLGSIVSAMLQEALDFCLLQRTVLGTLLLEQVPSPPGALLLGLPWFLHLWCCPALKVLGPCLV